MPLCLGVSGALAVMNGGSAVMNDGSGTARGCGRLDRHPHGLG